MASLTVGRFLGLVPQPPKGTATGANFLATNQSLVGTGTSQVVPSLSAYIQGNVNIGAGSVISVANGIPNTSIPGSREQSAAPSILLINGSLDYLLGHRQPDPDPRPLLLNTGTTFVNAIIGALSTRSWPGRAPTSQGFGP